MQVQFAEHFFIIKTMAEIDSTYELDQLVIVVTNKTVEILLAENIDALALYLFYILTSKRQKTNQIWATDSFCMKKFGWGNHRMMDAKRVLKKFDLITVIPHKESGKVVKWFIKINFLWSKEKTRDAILTPVETRDAETRDAENHSVAADTSNALSKRTKMLKVKGENTSGDTPHDESPPKYDPLGAEVIKAFEGVDSKNKTYYANKTQRSACDFLIKEYGLQLVLERIALLPQTNKQPFFPKINSPFELKEKWVKLEDTVESKRTEIINKQTAKGRGFAT
jgi:hypothetical protein